MILPVFSFKTFKEKIGKTKLTISQRLTKLEFIAGFRAGIREAQPFAHIHKSLTLRIFRVLGGIATWISIVLYRVYPTLYEQYIPSSLQWPILLFSLVFCLYLSLYFLTTFIYGLYLIITGKWITWNSPLRALFTEGKLVGVYYYSACVATGTVGSVGKGVVIVDTILEWKGDLSLNSVRPKYIVKKVWAEWHPETGLLSNEINRPSIRTRSTSLENQKLAEIVESAVKEQNAEIVNRLEYLGYPGYLIREIREQKEENKNKSL